MKPVSRKLCGAGDELWNRLSDLTGYAAIRLPLQRASGPDEVTLNLPGYQQLDNYSCGAVAAAMVVKFLKPAMGFERIYAAVNPHREYGTATSRAIRALSSLGIRASRKSNLTFEHICAAIEAGRPVMVCVTTNEKGTDHWVVIYGYGRRPNLVFVAGQGWPFVVCHRMQWRQFRRRWSPAGEGLVCWKSSRRNARPSPRPAHASPRRNQSEAGVARLRFRLSRFNAKPRKEQHMNQADTPFNPIVIPDLNLPSGEPPAAPAEPKATRRKTKPRPVLPRASRNGTLRRALTIPASEPPPAQSEAESPRRKASKSPATAKTRRALDPKRSALRFARKVTRKAKVSWKRVKAGITARLARLDQAKLKKVLIGCGVAAAVATAIVLVAKLTPLIVAMLALLGLGAVLQMWSRLRTLHPA